MSVQRYTYPDAAAAADACARRVLSLLDEALSGKGDATLAISGGATPRLLFDRLTAARFDWTRVHLFWVDERPVPPSDPQSNYRLAEEHLILPGHVPRRNLHRICGELPPEKAARRYCEEIREYFNLENGELPHFDVIQLGAGVDAHTASLFPGEPLLDDREGFAAAVYVPKVSQWRITMLPGVLLAARHTAFLVAGEDKAQAVRDTFQAPYEARQYPAQLITHHGRRVSWFLDQPAASLLD
ncbi:MAG: 6-phosphogluconolactonase [Acidobacteria bacterium]|nr:6-phosphogluconolactonase [Acidobacteriota bacterium]